MKIHRYYEDDDFDFDLNEVLKDDTVKVGDTIIYAGNNQDSQREWEVVEENGKKSVKIIDILKGGKRSRRKSKRSKRSRRKSKRSRRSRK